MQLTRLARHVTQNAVGYAALFVALGGTSFAAVQLTGRDVADGSLTGADIRDHSLSARDLGATAESARTSAGRRGPRGPRGFAGPPGVSGRQVIKTSSTSDSTPIRTVSALCPAGKSALGGGADIDADTTSTPHIYLNNSIPLGNQAGWTATAIEDLAGVDANWHIDAYVICAIVS